MAFTGSVSTSGGLTKEEQAIVDKMNANSIAWHSASKDEQNRLHAENQELSKQLGSASFDSGSGRWSVGGSANVVTPQKQRDDISDLIRKQQAAQLEAELAGLKSAYDKSMQGYRDIEARLPAQFDAARNTTAANDAIARRAFDERSIAAGLSSGAAAQEELARSSVLTRELAALDREESSTLADIALEKANLQTEYENAVAQATATNNAALAAALTNEIIRQQNIEREEAARLEEALAQAAKPTLTAAQALTALENGVINDTTLGAYQYYYGQPYSGKLGNGSGTPTGKGNGFDNGGLTNKQVAEMQLFYGLSDDGYWGPNSQSTTGMSAKEAWTKYQREKGGSGNALFDQLADLRSPDTINRYTNTALENAGERGLVRGNANGSYVWNGSTYATLNDLLAALELANLTLNERVALANQFDLMGLEIDFG